MASESPPSSPSSSSPAALPRPHGFHSAITVLLGVFFCCLPQTPRGLQQALVCRRHHHSPRCSSAAFPSVGSLRGSQPSGPTHAWVEAGRHGARFSAVFCLLLSAGFGWFLAGFLLASAVPARFCPVCLVPAGLCWPLLACSGFCCILAGSRWGFPEFCWFLVEFSWGYASLCWLASAGLCWFLLEFSRVLVLNSEFLMLLFQVSFHFN